MFRRLFLEGATSRGFLTGVTLLKVLCLCFCCEMPGPRWRNSIDHNRWLETCWSISQYVLLCLNYNLRKTRATRYKVTSLCLYMVSFFYPIYPKHIRFSYKKNAELCFELLTRFAKNLPRWLTWISWYLTRVRHDNKAQWIWNMIPISIIWNINCII